MKTDLSLIGVDLDCHCLTLLYNTGISNNSGRYTLVLQCENEVYARRYAKKVD